MSQSNQTRLAHLVFFNLKDQSEEACSNLITSCENRLAHQPGIVFFGVGLRGEEFTRPVNASDYQVGLHIIFESKSAHDDYQESDDHQAFLAENKPNFASIRVYDTYV